MEKAASRSQRCGAKARGTGEPCQKWALNGSARCRLHGGRADRPLVNGRYSKRLNATVQERMAAMRDDPVDFGFTDEIHRLEVLMEEVQALFDRGRAAIASGKCESNSTAKKAIAELRAIPDGSYFSELRRTVEAVGRMKERKVRIALATKFLVDCNGY